MPRATSATMPHWNSRPHQPLPLPFSVSVFSVSAFTPCSPSSSAKACRSPNAHEPIIKPDSAGRFPEKQNPQPSCPLSDHRSSPRSQCHHASPVCCGTWDSIRDGSSSTNNKRPRSSKTSGRLPRSSRENQGVLLRNTLPLIPRMA